MDADALRVVNGQTGTLVMDHKGQVLSATGELQGSQGELAAQTIFSMLQDSHNVLHTSNNKEILERMIINFPTYDFAVTLDDSQIYVVKRVTSSAQE